MSITSDTQKFLQAVFPDYIRCAVFANLNPPAHTRKLAELDAKRDCYWSIAAFPAEARTNLEDDALHTVALVIDDVGTKVPAGAVELALGQPTAIVESSQGNFQWVYRLSKPVAIADWAGFFAGVEALIGHKLEARSAQTLMRLPMGVNTKKGRNSFRPRLTQLNPGIELSPDTIPCVERSRPVALSSGEVKVSARALQELLRLIPNRAEIDRDQWVSIGHWAKGLCPEGCKAFIKWTLSWEGTPDDPGKHTEDSIRHSWDGFGNSGLLSQGGRLRAMAERINPSGFKRWDAATVFDDGKDHSQIPLALHKPEIALQVLSFDEFVEGFVPPDYLVKKLITRSFLYSLTGQTGAGKTSITLRLAATLALGRSFGGLGTKQCRVLYLAAENPVDIRMRVIALATEMGFEGGAIPIFFVQGNFSIKASMKALKNETLRVGGDFGLVVVDTGPVFFEGEDANDRVAMLRHARMMRELIETIPGKPAVIVNVHPIKNAGVDNLLPSGGGSFLNEVDGNLTAAKNEDQTIELHWQGKWRGVEFAPLHFLLKTVTHPRLIDSDGEAMPTVVCDHLSTDAKEVMEQAEFADQGKILAEMVRNPRASIADLAVHMGWYYASGKPDKSKVQRYVKTLIKQKLVKKHLKDWIMTGTAKAKMNGSGGHPVSAVSADTIRPDTIDTKEY
jgi:hypothetical protein